MKKKIITFCLVLIFLLMLIFGIYKFLEYKENQKQIQKNKRYEEIKIDVNKEMERYYYLVWPTCDPQNKAVQSVSDDELINNGGMDKEKFLDVDSKSYCDTITYVSCVEKNIWKFKTYIRCEDYIDDEFVDSSWH